MEKYGIQIGIDQQQDHLEDIKPIPILHLICTICRQAFNSKNDLVFHVKDHFKTYECEFCDKTFIGDTKYNYHLVNDHKKIHEITSNFALKGMITQYPCEFCDEIFIQKYVLTKHLRKLHRDKIHIPKPFLCDVCKKCFETYGVIKAHMRIHDIGEFMCELCGKNFAKKTNLQTHIRVHTGERIYHCENCGKSFTSASALSVHRRTHTGERRYQCQWCPKNYAHSTDLRRHKRIHTGEEKKLKCDLCDQRFYENKFLLNHQRTHHQMHYGKPWQKNQEKSADSINQINVGTVYKEEEVFVG